MTLSKMPVPAAAALLLPLAVSWVLTLNLWPGWPEPGQLSTAYLTHALYHRGELQIDTESTDYLDAEDLAERGGHKYSIKPPVLSLWLLAFAPAIDALTPGPLNVFQIIYFGRLIAQTLPLLVFLWCFGRMMERLAGPAAGWGCLLLLAAGTPFFCYANYLYAHALAAALLGGALAFLFRPGGGTLRPAAAGPRLMAASFMAALAAAGDFSSIPAAAALTAAAVIWGEGSFFKRCLAAAAGAALPVLVVLFYQQQCFGSAWTFSYLHGKGPWAGIPSIAYLFHGFDVGQLWQVTFGSWRGLFFYSPWTLAAVVLCSHALYLKRTDAETRRLILTAGAAFTAQVLFLSVYSRYPGSFSFGLRYLLPALPLLTAACAAALGAVTPKTRGVYLTALACTGLYSICVHAMAMAVFPMFPSIGPERVNSLQAFILPMLREGLAGLTLQDLTGPGWPWPLAVYWLPAAVCPLALAVICVRRGYASIEKVSAAGVAAATAALILWTAATAAGTPRTPESEFKRNYFQRMLVRPESRTAYVKGFVKMVWPGPGVTDADRRVLTVPARSGTEKDQLDTVLRSPNV